MADIPTDLQRLADRLAIQDCLYRYARGIDRRNWEVLASAFHPGATLHQGDFKGTIEQMLANVAERHAAIEQSAHLLANMLIEFADTDVAVVETYYLAYLRNAHLPAVMRATLVAGGAPEAEKIDMRSLGRYIDRVERRNGEWRIVKRICIAETLSGTAVADGSPLSPNWAMASRDPDDALWAMREEAGLK